jgi:tetratricopeptide (TPR) repeat protein
MMGLSLYFLGEPQAARAHFERMLHHYVAPARRSHIVRFQFDQRVTARVAFAEVLWVLGHPDQAMRTVETSIEEAEALQHALSLCNALAKALPVALLTGHLEAAGRYVSMLLDRAAQNALASWQAEGRAYQSVLLIKRGDLADGVPALAHALEELPSLSFSLRHTALLGELADGLLRAGRSGEALNTISGAIERAGRLEERWCMAELLRIQAEATMAEGRPGAIATAEAHLTQGLDWARQQQALSWELRCAMSLARLARTRKAQQQARSLLAGTLDRFREGFDTADLKAAKALLHAFA